MTGARQFKRSRLRVPSKLYGYEKEQNHSLEATLHSIVSHIDTGTKFDSEKCSALLDHLSLSEAEKWHVVAQTLYMNGARQGQISGKKIELAHQFALKALSLEQYNLPYWDTFFKVCRVIVAEWPDFQPPKAWSELLNFALKQNFLPASDKTWPIFQRVLENSREFQSLVELVETHQENLDSLIETAGQNSLLLSFLRKAATNGVAMERLVTKLRKACCRAIASQKVDEDKAVNVASALALTC